MKVLDLFCGAGGAAMGYANAGCQVVGIDNIPQPNYPFDFILADALQPPVDVHEFDLVHASPPCQAYSTLKTMPNLRKDHPTLIGQVRQLLVQNAVPYVIENVPGAPLRDPLVLCGSHFQLNADGYYLRRHRLFEASFNIPQPKCNHKRPVIGIFGSKARDTAKEKQHYRKPKETRGAPSNIVLRKDIAFRVMGITWMTMKELSQAIPPAYTEYIMAHFRSTCPEGSTILTNERT